MIAEVLFEKMSDIDDQLLRFAVVVSQYQGKWLYCRHQNRSTWEVPGGRREPGEAILSTAKRELFEETGALDYRLSSVCVYCVAGETKSYGLLCFAEIETLGPLPPLEIAQVVAFDDEPQPLTYPQYQSAMFAKVKEWLAQRSSSGLQD